MKDGDDMFGAIVRPAQKMGITIVARTDSQACLNDAAQAHPEWLNIDEDGRPRRHKSFPDTRTMTCAMGAYNFDFMSHVHREITEMYRIDGLFCNRWQAQSRGNSAPWSFGHRGKQMRTIFGPNKRIIGLGGMTLSSRHSVAPESEVKVWLLSAITNGLSPWLLKSSARNWDNRWIPAIEKVYGWHHENEKYLRNEENLARVAILFRKSEPRNPLLGSAASNAEGGDQGIDDAGRIPGISANDEVATAGMYQALVESRIPFEMAYNGKLEPADIDRYKLLILANAASLTDAECDKLRHYVNRGGSLLATFETSLYSEGVRRPNFGLSDLFGVTYAGATESTGPNAYIRLEHHTNHAMLEGLAGIEQVVSTRQHVNVRAVASFPNPPLTRIPTYPTDPMEQIFPPTPKTEIPEVYARIIGAHSRVVYFPGDIDSTFANSMAPDLALLIRNSVAWAMNDPQPVTVSGPGILEITCWRQANSMAVHMLNCTNPYMLRSAYRGDIPVGPQRVSIRVPVDRTVRDVKLLVAGEHPTVERVAGTLTTTVPLVVDHEVVAIDFS